MRAIYVLSGLLLVCGMTAFGQEVPDLMNYQGMLVDLGGTPVATGTYTLEFRIYDQISGGTLIWGPQLFDGVAGTGHSDRVAVVEGAFSVILGPRDTTGRSLLEAF